MIKKELSIAVRILGIMIVLTGIVYPLLVTGVAQLAFKDKANGSLVSENNVTKGSSLIGQKFDKPIYFSGRPSATGYNTLPSSGSNLSLTSKALHDTVAVRTNAFISANMLPKDQSVPSEMVFASASGLDPHISPESARLQINRIIKTRSFNDKQAKELRDLVSNLTENPQFGVFGEPRINVFMLNLELDKIN